MSANPEEVKENVELPEVRVLDDDIKVEVVDDTPEQDKGRKPLPKEVVDELENDSLEEYSEKVQQRIKQMKKVWHDERRAKEAAAREREEALNFARRVFEENKALKQRMGEGEKIFISEVTKASGIEVNAAKEKLKQAYEVGDAEKIAEAQEALMEAQLKLRDVRNFRPSLQDQEEDVQLTQQSQTRPLVQKVKPDSKAEAWREKNEWFGPNKGMTAFALGLHEELVENGIDPSSDEYYDRINRAVRKRFPEQFEDNNEPAEKPVSRKATPSVVAPATRSTAPRQVRLTSSQLALAKKFGLTPEQYAREMIKLENDNG